LLNPKSDKVTFKYYIVVPLVDVPDKKLPYTFIGESKKFLVASSQRIGDITLNFDTQFVMKLSLKVHLMNKYTFKQGMRHHRLY